MFFVTPPAHPAPAPQQQGALDRARAALHDGRPQEALALVLPWLAQHPADADARIVAGFAALQLDHLANARDHFQQARSLAPADVDAAYGLALCLTRSGEPGEAKVLLREALGRDPSRKDLQEALATSLTLAPDPPPPLPTLVRPATLQMPARVQGTRFEVRDGKGGWKPMFLKGMNLGAALPGKHPSEFPDKATYAAWLAEMAELGVNVLRVYTIHPPGLYEALLEHNRRAAKPLWLMHGVWTELPPEDDFSDPRWWGAWQAEMLKVVDLLHGRANIPAEPGHASGVYRADVSAWTLGIILGREWEPYSIEAYNRVHPGLADHRGRFLTLRQGHATEAFMARAMDTFLAYEFDTYHAQRPLAYTNWPTLDPLYHPTESTKDEEIALRRKAGLVVDRNLLREYDNDALGLDMEKVDALPACPAGLFASYHAYPYYPDFMNLDPGYSKGREAQGPNNYFAYLQDLVKYHRKHPVVISEFGVPSSRLVAHWQAQGLTHGGQNEREQGEHDARMFQAIHQSGCAGGMLFAWIDEWFKKNWLVIEFEEPLERKPLWYNVQDAEENYGLIAYHPGEGGPVIRIDGRAGDWDKIPDQLTGLNLRLKVVADEGWLHLGLFFRGPLPDWTKEGFVVAIDTHGTDLGDHQLPWGLGLRSEVGLEFIARFQGPQTAVYVDESYDLFTHRHARPYRSRNHEGGRFLMPRTESNRFRMGRDGTRFPEHQQEIGWLRRGTQDRSDPAFDSRAEWHEGPAGEGWTFLEARIPWGLLNVTDPSSRRVVRDTDPPTDEVGTVVTEGFRLALLRFRVDGSRLQLTDSLPKVERGVIPVPPRFTWPTWEQPTFHRVRKQSFDFVKACLRNLPD